MVVKEWVGRIVTTEINIHDNVLVHKAVIKSAIRDEFGKWYTPELRIGSASGDISGNAVPREEPNSYSITRPFGGIDSSSDAVESCTVGSWAA